MKLIPFSIAFLLIVIVLAHFSPPPGYHWTRNTISELASQGYARKWIMQAGFVGFGVLLAGGLVWRSVDLGRVNWPDFPVLVYAIAILVTGIYCAAPFDPDLAFSAREARVHSLFATLAGFALVAGMLWNLLLSPDKRGFHLTFLIMVTGLSLAFGFAESGVLPIGKGLVQRVLYLVSFAWLVIV